MKPLRLLSLFAAACVFLCSCSKSNSGPDNNDPEPGSTRETTADLSYYSALIEGSTSPATWPVVIFPVDDKAVAYKVVVDGFNGTWPTAKQTFAWKKGEAPNTAYDVFGSTKDIKDGKYYVSLGRTWCAGCTEADPQWEATYRKGLGTPKATITYQY